MSHLLSCKSCVVAVLVALVLTPAAVSAREVLDGPVAAQIVRIIDGDTIVVRARIWLAQEVETLVRLSGLDTPELRGRCEGEISLANQARAALEQAAPVASDVLLKAIENDKYGGRVVARVENRAGQDLTSLLIEKGLGRAYDGRKKAAWCG